jgi:hypothetical protein
MDIWDYFPVVCWYYICTDMQVLSHSGVGRSSTKILIIQRGWITSRWKSGNSFSSVIPWFISKDFFSFLTRKIYSLYCNNRCTVNHDFVFVFWVVMSHTSLCHNHGILGMTHSYTKCGMYKVIITMEAVKNSQGSGVTFIVTIETKWDTVHFWMLCRVLQKHVMVFEIK